MARVFVRPVCGGTNPHEDMICDFVDILNPDKVCNPDLNQPDKIRVVISGTRVIRKYMTSVAFYEG